MQVHRLLDTAHEQEFTAKYMSRSMPQARKESQIEAYGSELIPVPGPRSNASKAVRHEADSGITYASHVHQPYVLPGYATAAFEIYEQLDSAPGSVIVPAGQGSFLLGIARGFEALVNAGEISQTPQIIGVQSMACAPLWAAMQTGHGVGIQAKEGETIAEGIRVVEPLRKEQVLAAVKSSNGKMAAVEEQNILSGRDQLAKRGFHVEPTSAVVWQALLDNLEQLREPIVVVLTGSGLKFRETSFNELAQQGGLMADKIVITGMGTVNPLGKSVEESWKNAVEGKSGIAPITLFDPEDFPVKLAGEVKDFQPNDYMLAKEARRRDRFEQLSAAAAQEVIQHAGIDVDRDRADRVGVIVSSAIGGLESIAVNIEVLLTEGAKKASPFIIPQLMSNGAASFIAIDHQFQGPSFSVASACASGADAIGIAKMLIQSGVIDVAITGGSDATVTEITVAAFDKLRALSHRNELPARTPQPFDKNRDGLVIGEGAAVLVLEKESGAKSRGANIHAELAGYGSTVGCIPYYGTVGIRERRSKSDKYCLGRRGNQRQ